MDKTYPENIIFLDIDGCLTSQKDGTYFNPDEKKYHPSKRILDLLKTFCMKNYAKIVISSNWRRFEIDGVWKCSIGTFKNPLKEVLESISECYFDTLSPRRHVRKSEAIVEWLNHNEDFKGNFVIFDDDENEGIQNTEKHGLCYRFILVNNEYGITDMDLMLAQKILQKY